MKYLLVIILLGGFSCNTTKKSTEKEDQLLSSYQVSLLHSKLSLDKKPTLKLDFESNKISGNAGCNDYGANMVINENKIQFNKVFSTKMYCGNMKTETEFFKKLSKVDHYKVKGDNLFLYDKGDVLLITCKSITE